MKNFLVSLFAGAIGAGLFATFIAPSFASPSSAPIDANQIHDAIQTGQCQAVAGYPRMTGGGRCFSGEVMTGTWDNYIYCADIRVTCN